MRNLAVKYVILSLFLVALAGNAFGQETGWEFDHLQGKVKIFAEYNYDPRDGLQIRRRGSSWSVL